ncbi:MAG TPA: host attachment protein [Thiobacillaceae bacterium]|nr:host attachment protein [Thiobacillaceae bacterium]HNU63061.1 host attachment protein [Thiobacillaceae bacterium]
MSVTWIMVANASQARLFANHGPKRGLELVREFTHPESREKTSNLVSDRLGAMGMGHGAFIQSTNPKHHEAERFAQEVARELDAGRVKRAYDRLILVASSPFMGLMNASLPGQVRSKVSESIDKDYTRLPVKELAGHLEQVVYL